MRTWHLVVLSGVVSAVVSAGTVLLLRDGERPAGASVPGVQPEERPATPPGATGVVLKGAPSPIEKDVRDLKEAVARLERDRTEGALPTHPTPAQAAEVFAHLVSIQQGEQLLAIRDSMEALIRCGDAAVPAAVEYLRSGKDLSYGSSGISTSGNRVTAYGRLRSVLIDALRQIGTPTAKEGLLEAVHRAGSLEDYRDLLVMYGGTTDPEMTAGISALVPVMLDAVRERSGAKADEQAAWLAPWLARWIQSRRVTAALPALSKVVQAESGRSGWAGDLFGALVDLAPEEAFRVVEGTTDAAKRREVLHSLMARMMGMNDVRRAALATFIETLLSRLDLTPYDRMALYSSVPGRLCRNFPTDDERVADARVLLAFLDKRLAVETDETPRRVLVPLRDGLAKAIEAAAPAK